MSRYVRLFVLVIVPLTIAAGIVAWRVPITRGLDIAGGIRVVLQADPQRGDDWPKTRNERLEKMRSIRKTITERIKGMGGVTEPVVQVQEDDRLVVELPGVENPEEALRKIRSTAALEFYYLKNVRSKKNPFAPWEITQPGRGGSAYIFQGPRGETINSIEQPEEVLEKVVGAPDFRPVLTGVHLLPTAKANISPPNEIVMEIEFNREGTKIFRDFTESHVDEYLAIFFDGKLLTAPTINEKIPQGRAQVSGFTSLAEARETADYLNAGALPIPLKVIAMDSVEPTLGKDTVNRVLVAGLVGLGLVILFMMGYYRLPGVIASVTLGLYALYTISFFKIVHATMSLAGFAALIISIGMAVDANVLIFERLKEELRSGKTLRAAIDAGFNRAFTAIFDSNVCTAITCAILLWFGTPSVQSFAFTLLFGVAISMFTAITVTRTILHLLVGWEWAQKPGLYGLGTSWIARAGISLDVVGKRAYYFVISAIVVGTGAFYLGVYGLNPGIEFKSGTTIQASFKQPVALGPVRSLVNRVAKGSEVQLAEQRKSAFIRTTLLREDPDFERKIEQLRAGLNERFGLATVSEQTGQPVFDAVSSVGPTISEELTRNAIIAVIIASIAIVIYIAFRFAIGGLAQGFKYGGCAVVALVHDSVFILGMFAILGKFAKWEVDSLFVTAILTVIGYSVHDTIVVFDRIRENLRHRQRGETYEQLCNRSILQTFSRSINTSLTVVITLGALIVFGGPLLRQFYFAMLAGIVIGTYSSIFNATPLLVVWDRLASGGKSTKRKEFEDRPMVSKPIVSGPDAPEPANGIDEEIEEEASTENGSIERKQAAKPGGRIKRKKRRF